MYRLGWGSLLVVAFAPVTTLSVTRQTPWIDGGVCARADTAATDTKRAAATPIFIFITTSTETADGNPPAYVGTDWRAVCAYPRQGQTVGWPGAYWRSTALYTAAMSSAPQPCARAAWNTSRIAARPGKGTRRLSASSSMRPWSLAIRSIEKCVSQSRR